MERICPIYQIIVKLQQQFADVALRIGRSLPFSCSSGANSHQFSRKIFKQWIL